MSFKALIADFGGVLTNPIKTVVEDWREREHIDEHGMSVVFGGHQQGSFSALERGEITQLEWERAVAEQIGVPAAGLLGRIMATLAPAEPMIEAVRDARRRGYRTACLTNSFGTHPYNAYAPYDLDSLFDVVVVSGEEKIAKPDPEIYLRTIARLGVRGPECVFVDDSQRHLAPARELGMTTIHCTDAAHAAEEIARLLV